jgi:uncharacterized membrane protein
MWPRLTSYEFLSRLNASYWFVPLVVTLAGVALAVALLNLGQVTPSAATGALSFVVPSSPEGARVLLSAVISSMITTISVTFSVSIVAFTVAAQHFGPRVLNNFVRHTAAQVVLGIFIATFLYAVVVLGAVKGTGEDAAVPQAALAGAVLLVVVSVGALIYYVHHISTSLQVGEIAAEIASDFVRALDRREERSAREAPDDNDAIPDAPEDAATVTAPASGYMQRIDYERIARKASERDAQVWVRREPGAFVLAAAPLALVAPAAACDDELASEIRKACVLGRDRTLWRDPEFSVKQLVEVALRALSPGVNEPFTATTCIDRLSEGLAAAATAPPPRALWRDRSERARVFAQAQPFPMLLRAAFDPIRIHAAKNPAIYTRLLEALVELAQVAHRGEDLSGLRHQLEVVGRAGLASVEDPDDQQYLQERIAYATKQFDGQAAATRH